jgi:hypothetical protein
MTRVLTNRMGMGIRYDRTHTNHTVLLLIFDTVHTAPYGGAYGGPGPVTQCHSELDMLCKQLSSSPTYVE